MGHCPSLRLSHHGERGRLWVGPRYGSLPAGERGKLLEVFDVKATVKWKGDVAFEGLSETGHSVMMDGPPEHGGKNRGPRPMEMLLLGMGGCTSFDVVHILRRMRADITDCQVNITAERAHEEPKVFTKIHAHFIVTGRGLKESAVERAVSMSAEKYCSAAIMLGKTAEMSHTFEIVEG